VSYLYSLYDALVSIAVPADKARAVVDAMEHDMGTTLATKSDLENLRLATKSDLENLRLTMKSDINTVRLETKAEIDKLGQEIDHFRKEMEAGFKAVAEKFTDFRRELAKDIADERKSVIIQLGSVIVACFAISLGIMRYWLN
jgi:hypothetical protein